MCCAQYYYTLYSEVLADLLFSFLFSTYLFALFVIYVSHIKWYFYIVDRCIIYIFTCCTSNTLAHTIMYYIYFRTQKASNQRLKIEKIINKKKKKQLEKTRHNEILYTEEQNKNWYSISIVLCLFSLFSWTVVVHNVVRLLYYRNYFKRPKLNFKPKTKLLDSRKQKTKTKKPKNPKQIQI